ncbi:MAG: cation transporter [Actinomycetota bacterium]|nr:cation transporter [Actinomycetota bacterium]MDQ3681033.1 cation transporter [Actinomycetota bacterium]
MTAPAHLVTGGRPAAVTRARRLNRLTLGWNVVEGVVALGAGMAAGSVSLIGFGLDSVIEVSASLALAWRLHQEGRGGCMAEYDRRATRAIAVSFAALAGYVWFQATRDLLGGAEPEASVVGVVLAAVSLAVMPVLARAKRRLAPALGSRAAASEADQTRLCALLSAVVLVGLGLNAVLGWWWADPVAALALGVVAAGEAVRTWRADALEDTCCP